MILTQEITNKIWRYEPETGHFFWKISPKNGIFIGDRAGYFDNKYWRLRYKKNNYKASRVAWFVMTGSWPKEQIDHINGNKLDDRFCNLREATNAENCRNRGLRKDNKLKIKGVFKTRYSYVAQVCVNGESLRLGSFKTLEEAKTAYDYAARKLHGEFARL